MQHKLFYCDKVTRVLRFVAPNKKILVNRLLPQARDWIKSRGQLSIETQIICLTTPKKLQKCNLSNESWLIVFDMRKSEEPIICKVDLD
jgi:hypothetical protein